MRSVTGSAGMAAFRDAGVRRCIAFAMSALASVSSDPIRLRSAMESRAFFGALANDHRERCAFAYLDPEWRLLGMRESAAGSTHSVRVPLREVVADLLRLGSFAVVMVHNHPGDDLTPSDADLAVTRRVIAALDAIDVRLVDHVVLGRGGHASMRDMGLL